MTQSLNVTKIKEKLAYLTSIQTKYTKKNVIQYQISFLHSVLEFYYNNKINVNQLGVYHSNNNYNYLLEEMHNEEIQRFISNIKHNYMSLDFWNEFTTSKYRRGVSPDKDICVDDPILLKYIERLSNIGEINLHIIDDNLFIQEFPSDIDGSDNIYYSVIKEIPIDIKEHQFESLMKYANKSFKYINISVNGSHVIIGYDKSELVFEYNVTNNVMKNYLTKKLTLEYNKSNNHDATEPTKPTEANEADEADDNAWLFKNKNEEKR